MYEKSDIDLKKKYSKIIIVVIVGGIMKKTIRDYDLSGKKVIIRVDFNVPMKDGKIQDDNRIVESLPTIKYAIDKMNKNGIIINISSNNAIDAHTSLSYDYDASKAGINMLTKDFALAIEEEKKDLVIVSICPGWINTDAVNSMNPVFLKQELERTNQKELLDKCELVKYIVDNIKNYKNGEVVVVKELEK